MKFWKRLTIYLFIYNKFVYIKIYINYYPQVFVEKDKHVVGKKRSYFITDDLKIYSDDSDDSDEKTQMKTIKYINLFLKETRTI